MVSVGGVRRRVILKWGEHKSGTTKRAPAMKVYGASEKSSAKRTKWACVEKRKTRWFFGAGDVLRR